MENVQTSINERIKDIVVFSGKTINQCAKYLKVSQPALRACVNGDNKPSFDVIEKITIGFPTISESWLISGSGDMIKKDEYIKTKPRIPFAASAGFLTSSVNGITIDECEKVPVINSFPTYDYTILVKGESMHPEIKSGDEVACKRIDENRFIQWGRIHVLDTTQGVVIKKIYDENEGIRCVSTNSDYKDFVIPKEDIYSISLVVGLLRL